MRLILLTCARNELLKNDGAKAARAATIIMALEGNYYASGKAGHASLARACWEICNSKG